VAGLAAGATGWAYGLVSGGSGLLRAAMNDATLAEPAVLASRDGVWS
jgi:hypothetical protein